MISVLLISMLLCVALTALTSFMSYRWWMMARCLRIAEEVMWRSKSELATVKSDLEESAMHVSILQDKLALYKTQLSAEQLANLRETQGVADAIKKIQQTGTVQQRIDLGRSVLVGYNSAGFNHATEVKSDPDRVDTVRLAPAAKGAKP